MRLSLKRILPILIHCEYFVYTCLIWFLILATDTVVYRRLRVQVEEEDYFDGLDNSDYETDDSNGISLSLLIFTLNVDHY